MNVRGRKEEVMEEVRKEKREEERKEMREEKKEEKEKEGKVPRTTEVWRLVQTHQPLSTGDLRKLTSYSLDLKKGKHSTYPLLTYPESFLRILLTPNKIHSTNDFNYGICVRGLSPNEDVLLYVRYNRNRNRSYTSVLMKKVLCVRV